MFLKKIVGVKCLALIQNQGKDFHISESPTGGIHLLSLGWLSPQVLICHSRDQQK